MVDKAVEQKKQTVEALNLKKQYKRAVKAAQEREDWSIVEEKNIPNGAAVKDSFYFYLIMQPGVFKLAVDELSKFLCRDQKIRLKTGRPNRYGNVTTTNTCNYMFKIGGKEKTLQLRYYPTKSAIDVAMTGSYEDKAEKYVEFGMKNGAQYFIEEVMPRFIDFLYQNFEVENTNDYWEHLAQTGFEHEMRKDGEKAKGKGKGKGKSSKNNPAKTKEKCGCGHCQKVIGSKIAIQCEGCSNMNLVECLSHISENKVKDFQVGNDTFVCGKCVLTNVDSEDLSIALTNAPALEMEDEAVMNDEEVRKMNELKQEITKKDAA